MSHGLGAAVDAGMQRGTVQVEADGRRAEVEVVDHDRLGASLGRVRVIVPEGASVQQQARRMPEALRLLPEDVVPVEVAPNLGGAVYRTTPDQMSDGEYFEVRTAGGEATLERLRREDRRSVPFDLTRDQLRRLVDGLGEALAED